MTRELLNLSDCAVCVDWIWHILLLFNDIIKMSNYKRYVLKTVKARNNQNIFYIYAKEISTLVKLMSIIDLEN